MKIADYSKAVKETWSVFNAMRVLGFDSDDIYIIVDDHGTVQVDLKTQNKIFSVYVVESGPTFIEDFKAFVALIKADEAGALDSQLLEIYVNSMIYKHHDNLYHGLESKGIVLPDIDSFGVKVDKSWAN